MNTYTFTTNNDIVTEMEGFSPMEALHRRWASCLPDTRLNDYFLCHDDEMIYRPVLVDGQRVIACTTAPIQTNGRPMPVAAQLIGGRS